MIVKFFGGSLDGKELEAGGDGWQELYAIKVGHEFYRMGSLYGTIADAHYSENEILPPGKQCRMFPPLT